MGLTAREMTAVVREIAPVVTGAWIQKVFQPTPRSIVLELRAKGRTVSLLLSAEPQTTRVHLLSRRLPNPPAPPSFCQFLRAHVQGARIEAVEQPAGDRIIRLRLTARHGPCALIGQLTGRTADVVLLDESETVLASLADRQKARSPYAAPRGKPRDGEGEEAEPAPLDDPQHPFPISFSLEQRYQDREAEAARARLRQARLAEIRKAIKKTGRRVDALLTDLEKAARYKGYARYGELLKANLPLMKKGQDQITVTDYFDPAFPELVIPLDASKSPHRNMEDYFMKHRKHLAAEREVRPRLKTAEGDLEALRSEYTALQRGTWEPAPSPFPLPIKGRGDTLFSPLPRGERTKVRGSQARGAPFRRFVSTDGLPIYVGRNARENEELTFGVARSDDLWLHAHGTPGSHVVVRLERGSDPPVETLKDAATLALLYSDLKKSGKGEVLYTRRKWVRKVKGRDPGTVTVTQEKTLFVALDRGRLDRLKERRS